MTKIQHNLGIERDQIAVRFETAMHEPIKGGAFHIQDSNLIELDDEWLSDHPEICYIVIFSVYDHEKKFGWTRYGEQDEPPLLPPSSAEAWQELGRAFGELVNEAKKEIVRVIDAVKDALDGKS